MSTGKISTVMMLGVVLAGSALLGKGFSEDFLETGFKTPPPEARLHAYWWWLNGNVTAEAITHDLESMKEKGFNGALITDAGGANQDGNRQVPRGPVFASEPWREFYRHALREGARLNMEMALNIQSGWNLGGPGVKAEDAAKILCWAETVVTGPGQVTVKLTAPLSRNGLLREVCVFAVPDHGDCMPSEIRNWALKALVSPVSGGNGNVAGELEATPATSRVFAIDAAEIINVTKFVDAHGNLTWSAPAGNWRILRFCYTVSPGAHVSTCSQGWDGLALDPMDGKAFQRYWDSVVEPLMLDAEGIKNHTLKYLHTDSWEIEPFNWTARLPEEFQKRRGYDMMPWMPVLAKCVVGSVEDSERFLHDFRRTVADLVAENYYGPFLENAHRHGMLVRAESGGPHGVPIDAQHCLGMIDVPMSEFWATSWRHRVPEKARFFVKQPASAAHTYGKRLVAAEGFTTIGPHWQETVWDNLKPNFDKALCEGLNQLVWTLVTCSPKEMGMPGQEMFPGTHFNPNSTWWRQSEGFLSYINRCQWLLQQGLFVGDVLYYYGDIAPNFAGLKSSNPAKLPAGYDYDVGPEYVLLNRVSVKAGRIVLPDGPEGGGVIMSYGALVLPAHPNMSLPVLRKLRELAEAGAVIAGVRPGSSSGLKEWQKGDVESRELIGLLWGTGNKPGLIRHADASAWLNATGLKPDCEFACAEPCPLDYIHRRDGSTDIYFVSNRIVSNVNSQVRFRVAGKVPELWDAVTGEIRALSDFRETDDGRTEVGLTFEPCQSWFVVFKGKGAKAQSGKGTEPKNNFPELKPVQEIAGAWDVEFDEKWLGGEVQRRRGTEAQSGKRGVFVFEKLDDWTSRPEEGIKYYSGTAVYRKSFDLPQSEIGNRKSKMHLALGEVREMARVRLNGRDLGVVWCPPWRVDVTGAVKSGSNELEIEVVNFWPNRLIGDAMLPLEQRRTKTNISKFDNPDGKDPHYTRLMSSGLLGPVRIMGENY